MERTGDEITPAFLIMAAAAVTLAALFWFRETYHATITNKFGLQFLNASTAGSAYRLSGLTIFIFRRRRGLASSDS